jgi:N6-adenosine-specific RNA methylase IME4
MTLKEISDLKTMVGELADDNCHLYLWTTNNFLQDALWVMRSWGFEYKTIITWLKQGHFGLGQYFRGKTEHCLFGVRGTLPYKIEYGQRQQGVTFVYAPKGKHSEKPDEMRHLIETVSYLPYIELFARGRAPAGWDIWGDQAEGGDNGEKNEMEI